MDSQSKVSPPKLPNLPHVHLTLSVSFGKIQEFSEGDVVSLNESEVEHGREDIKLAQEL